MIIGSLEPMLSLLRDHGSNNKFSEWKASNDIQAKSFCLKYISNDAKTLYYIAAEHTTDKNSNTFHLINEIVPKCEIVIIEGIRNGKGINPILNTDFISESSYAINVAKSNDIKYVGIECDEAEIIRGLANKFAIDDIYGWYYLRNYKFAFSTQHLSFDDFKKQFDGNLSYLNEILGKSITYDFIEWFKKCFNEEFIYGEYIEYASPDASSDLITHQIAVSYGKQRDSGNLQNMFRIIDEYNTVCVIMGYNHSYADMPVLTERFNAMPTLYPSERKINI